MIGDYVTTRNLTIGVRDRLVPVGSLLDFAGSAAPSGYLLCDGSVVTRDTYPALFAVVSTTYNTGGEAGYQFRLPDLRGRMAVGVGTDGTASNAVSRTLAAAGGDTRLQTHTHVQDSHTHTQNAHTHTQDAHGHDLGGGQSFGMDFGGNGGAIATFGVSVGIINTNTYQGPYSATANTATNQNTTATNQNTTATNQNAGSGTGENMPPFVTLNKIIKY